MPPRPVQPSAAPAPPPPPTAPTAADLKKSSGSYDPAATAPEKEEGWLSGGMLGGLGAMFVGAVWLAIGLALDRLFIYPIIIFVIGVGTFIKGWLDNK
jgi:predicted lipid-binding transport protein (Tim44 family)